MTRKLSDEMDSLLEGLEDKNPHECEYEVVVKDAKQKKTIS